MKIKTSNRGSDDGSALALALALIFLLSILYLSAVSYTLDLKAAAKKSMETALAEIERENRAVAEKYELY